MFFFVVPVKSGWRLMEVDRGYNGGTFVMLNFSLVQEENSGRNFKGAGTCIWMYGGARSLEAEMIEEWKEEMMKV